MKSPQAIQNHLNDLPSSQIYESMGKDALSFASNLYEAWSQDARRLHETHLAFFNRRFDKDVKSLYALSRCTSLGAFIDIEGKMWSEMLADYADLFQGDLCWFSDTLQHGVDESGKANGWPVPWLTSLANASREMT